MQRNFIWNLLELQRASAYCDSIVVTMLSSISISNVISSESSFCGRMADPAGKIPVQMQ
jgi:hypothetical protein